MTIRDLEQYADKKRELNMLTDRLRELSSRSECTVADTVRGSSASSPFVQHTITVRGYSTRTLRAVQRLSVIIASRQTQLVADLADVEEFIATIPDSRVRQLIEYRYVDLLSWSAAACRVYGHPCGDTARMRVRRALHNDYKQNF